MYLKRYWIGVQAGVIALLLVVSTMIVPSNALEELALPDGSFVDTVVASDLESPTAMDFSPEGSRLFVAEKGGNLKVIKDGVLLADPFLSVPVDDSGERGLLGVAFDPNFAVNGFVYVYYTTSDQPVHNRISRFTAADPSNPDVALAGSELPILELEDLDSVFHNGGAIHFGPDDNLYVTVGDNANSTNAQSIASRLGKILRINPDGTIPEDNPFYNTEGAKKEIFALGLRNPFTFAFSPDSTKMYINDVGQNSREEINSGAAGANFGWPTCEGSCSNPLFVDPIYEYEHPSTGEGRAISGGAFYESDQFPPEYRGSYFFGDYVAGFIKRFTPDNAVVDFLSDVLSPVDIKIGSDGTLYYLAIGSGEVHRVEYVAGLNNYPTAVATASLASGAAPLEVTFDGSESSDPDGDILEFSWNFGDGSPTANSTIATHTYDLPGQYTAELVVNDVNGGFDSATIEISVGSPPLGAIDLPANSTKYDAGDIIFFNGSGSDLEDGILPASTFKWGVLFHHNTHTHPFQEYIGVMNASFAIPTIGETADDVWYRIYLTVTDSSGLSHISTSDVLPNKSTITLDSNIHSLQLSLDGQPQVTPKSFLSVVGMSRTLEAPLQQELNGAIYRFQSWSDGGAPIRAISTPADNVTYTAAYSLVHKDGSGGGGGKGGGGGGSGGHGGGGRIQHAVTDPISIPIDPFTNEVQPGTNVETRFDIEGLGHDLVLEFDKVVAYGTVSIEENKPSEVIEMLSSESIGTATGSRNGFLITDGIQSETVNDIFDIKIAEGLIFEGMIRIAMPYDESIITSSGFSEDDVRILHYDGMRWQDRTISVNTLANTVTGIFNSLSPIVVAVVEGETFSSVYFEHNPLHRTMITNSTISGKQTGVVHEVVAGEQIEINATLQNIQRTTQHYACIVQIIDPNGYTVSIDSSNSDKLNGGEMKELTSTWTALNKGRYTVMIYILDDVPGTTPTALSQKFFNHFYVIDTT